MLFALTTLSAVAGRATSLEWSTVDRSSVTATAAAFFPRKPGAPPVEISNMTTAGPYAVVSFNHGEIEGKTSEGELLLQRFYFGWQVVDVTTDRQFETTDLLARGIAAPDVAIMLPGALPANANAVRLANTACAADVGGSTDVADVRRLMSFRADEAIGVVSVVSGYALAGWGGNGGGMDAFAKRSGVWYRLGGGGGAMDTRVLTTMGMPRAAAQLLMQQRGGC